MLNYLQVSFHMLWRFSQRSYGKIIRVPLNH